MNGHFRTVLLLTVGGCAGAPNAPADDLPVLHRRIGRDPSDAEAHLRLGLLWARAGDGLRAQQYLEKAWALGADPRRSLPPLIRVSLALSSWEAALRHAEVFSDLLAHTCATRPSAEACADAAEALSTAAALHDSLGHPLRARDLFLAALRTDPRLADAYLGLARLQAEGLGDPQAARETLRRGLLAVLNERHTSKLRTRLADLDSGDPR